MKDTVGKHILFAAAALVLFAPAVLGMNLKDTGNRADYVIVAPTQYCGIAERLAEFRRQKNGFTAKVVDMDSILDQFGTGVSPDTALRNFIQYAVNKWAAPVPAFFVLAGNINTIPSHPESETLNDRQSTEADSVLMIDQWFVQVVNSNGTMRTDACLGRLPAWDSTGLSNMIDKTIEYEMGGRDTWLDRALSLSDYDAGDGDVFESDANTLRTYLDSLCTDTIRVDIRKDSPYHIGPEGFVDLWNRGAAFVSYFGHAGPGVLSTTHYFTVHTIDSLTNDNRLPVCLLGGCELNFDDRPGTSIPVHLLDREGGGAVAVVSSEGLMDETTTLFFFVSMIQSMTAKPDQPIGKAYEQAMPEWWWELYQRFTFLGDPALTLKRTAHPDLVAMRPIQARPPVLEQNYPNPFNPVTIVRYHVPNVTDGGQPVPVSRVTLIVYDVLGREVRTLVDEDKPAGSYSVSFNAAGLPSGTYLYRIQAGNYSQTRKLVLIK